MKTFITGIAGFLGSHLADALIEDGHEVVGIDNMVGGDAMNVPERATFYPIDCNSFDNVNALMRGSDIVYHCAALAHEGLSVFSPHTITKSIVGASTSVFSAAIANKVQRIIYCSSMARYGAHGAPFDEIQAPRPQDPYGIGKVCAEQMLRNLCEVHGVDYVIAVPHNIIGPRQKYDDPYRNVASIMLNLCLREERPIIYGNGEQQRCFSYVTDCLSCLTRMSYDLNVVGEVINIGPDEETISINGLFAKIAKITGFRGTPQYVPDRPQEVKLAFCDSSKARRLLDYRTTVSLDDGLRSMAEAIKARGTRPFTYHLPLEIVNERTPVTWTKRLF